MRYIGCSSALPRGLQFNVAQVMIVRQFLHWIRNAPAGMRAEATGALVRAYLFSELSEDDRAAAEGAMLMLLDDPSPLVRHALADGLADSPYAPPAVIHALASDQPEIATLVLEHSVLFIDADLVEIVANGDANAQAAIARRTNVPRAIAAAIAEVGSAEACLILIENADADVAQFSIDRIAARFGTLAAIRESLLARIDLPASTRQALVAKLSEALAEFVTARQWLAPDRAQRVAKEACEKAAVTIAADVPGEARALIRHLRETAQLNVGLVLRALLSGNTVLFEEALAELSDVPLARIHGIVHDRGAASFRALYDKAGLPASTYPAFREAIAALREARYSGELGGSSRLKRRMIERVLRGCEHADLVEVEPLLMLLRRFATEAAREETRLYCDELVAIEQVAMDEFDSLQYVHADDAPVAVEHAAHEQLTYDPATHEQAAYDPAFLDNAVHDYAANERAMYAYAREDVVDEPTAYAQAALEQTAYLLSAYGQPAQEAVAYDAAAYDPALYQPLPYVETPYQPVAYDGRAYDRPAYDRPAYDSTAYENAAYADTAYAYPTEEPAAYDHLAVDPARIYPGSLSPLAHRPRSYRHEVTV